MMKTALTVLGSEVQRARKKLISAPLNVDILDRVQSMCIDYLTKSSWIELRSAGVTWMGVGAELADKKDFSLLIFNGAGNVRRPTFTGP